MDGWMNGEDLIICVAFLVVQKLQAPLTSDDFRAISIASRDRLRLAWRFKITLEGLGIQHGSQIPFFGMFSIYFSIAFWCRFGGGFGWIFGSSKPENNNFDQEKQGFAQNRRFLKEFEKSLISDSFFKAKMIEI